MITVDSGSPWVSIIARHITAGGDAVNADCHISARNPNMASWATNPLSDDLASGTGMGANPSAVWTGGNRASRRRWRWGNPDCRCVTVGSV